MHHVISYHHEHHWDWIMYHHVSSNGAPFGRAKLWHHLTSKVCRIDAWCYADGRKAATLDENPFISQHHFAGSEIQS